jgi:hypothetical protein
MAAMSNTGRVAKIFLRRPDWIAAVIISCAIIGLHFFFWLHAGGLWRDEVNLVNLAGSHSMGDMAKDSFPVLMPLLVKGWTTAGLGQNDLSLRFFGTLVGLGIVTAFWIVAWRTRRPPLFSLALFGLNAPVIFYGDSLRGYGLGCLLIVLAVAAMLAFLKNPSWVRAGIFAAAAILSVQALYQNAVLVAAICLGAWSVCCHRKNFPAALKIFAAALVAAVSLLPYWNNFFGLSGASDPLRVGFAPDIAFANFSRLAAYPLPQFIFAWELLVCVLIGLGLAVLHPYFSKSPAPPEKSRTEDLPLFAAATMVAALVGFIGFLWFAKRLTEPWYFLPLAAMLVICFDMGISSLSSPKWIRISILGAIVVIALAETTSAQHDLNMRFTNVDELATQLNDQASPQDFVLVTPWFCGISFERYCNSNLTWQTVPPMADHSVHRYDLLSDEMKNAGALGPLFSQMTATLKSGHRVWVISSTTIGEIKIPEDNVRRPNALPPPPLKSSGWAEWPYCANWAAQTAWFLKHNSIEFAATDAAAAKTNVSHYEHLELFMASGWKNKQTNSSALPAP